MGIYGRLLHSHPLLTKSITTGAIFGGGDVLAQSISKDPEDDISLSRVATTAAYGAGFQGPFLHFWFGRLEKIWPGASVQTIAKKIVSQALVYAPLNVSLYSAWAGYHNTADDKNDDAVELAIQNAMAKAPSIWMDGNYFWIPLNVMIFSIVPLPFRPVAVNGGSVVWTTYMSFRANESLEAALL
ncbi:Aste57867_8100 [Aphanomyces stellatus]|uniref:Aste57867_8100 protein n=1 Tax=Aphanomyces stellatus TaxID=120398 RepID=A0A485KJG2_9STRA|nr:hypothetical protein As57867_008070 [Aphanomyces stellatus]VFT84989.1 Aste57867_8100 [Aphanomyces stellatus]